MDNIFQSLMDLALNQGIWAALYIYLFFRMIKQNEEREKEYQSIINKLSDGLQDSIDEVNSRLSIVEKVLYNKKTVEDEDKEEENNPWTKTKEKI